MLNELKADVETLASAERAKNCAWFFKTGPGEYGEGDKFLGLTVPEQRRVAKNYKSLNLDAIQALLDSEFHEHRFIALAIMVYQYSGNKITPGNKKAIFDFYLKNINRINNWDLVDSSASYIVGDYLQDKPRALLYELARSDNLWARRISIISTAKFISAGQFEDTLKISKILLGDKHDLIHKAVGWMLREVWKKDRGVAEEFLRRNYASLPRTTLRYAIERFEERKRKRYLAGTF